MTTTQIIILAGSSYLGAKVGSFMWERIGQGPHIVWSGLFALAAWGGAFMAMHQ
ncbi:hypothetical protein [Burkholderia multivorans]|uniref:hypothetical protein n=1 Tax=Burkholderia multivorans TaxID=87883 RepID=UPI0009E0DBB0|nr:hypothetical protein [Burkholderia multivorans]SAJ89149.1 hypothetical protein UA11_04031 [Burkholderia multivorans]